MRACSRPRQGDGPRPGRSRAGAAAVELAVILPVFLSLILGQIEMSRLGMVTQLLTTAAREGGRVAAIDGRTQADVLARVQQVLAGSGMDALTMQVTPSNWATLAGGQPITVTLSVEYGKVSWLPVPNEFKAKKVTAAATFNSERP